MTTFLLIVYGMHQ